MPPSSPRLPLYACDGRPVIWNADRSAATFDSSLMEYHSDTDAVSSSLLKALSRSGAHALALMDNPPEETATQRLGSAVHTLLLEPALFKSGYAIYDRRRGSTDWDIFAAQHAGKVILTRKEFDAVVGCAHAIRCTPAVHADDDDGGLFTVGELLASPHAVVERNIYWVDALTGLTCRARADLCVLQATFDVKTTDDARAPAFAKQAARMGYDLQAAFYLRARRAFDLELRSCANLPFLFIAAEIDRPWGTQVHLADPDEFIAFGDRQVDHMLQRLLQYRTRNEWPGYAPALHTLKLPLVHRYPQPLAI